MVADPATHSKKDVFVSVIWSWEQGFGGFGDAQLMHPGKIILPDEQDLPDRLAVLAAERRLQRVKAFRQMQACSNTLSELTGGRFILDSLELPPDVHVRAVKAEEVRVLL